MRPIVGMGKDAPIAINEQGAKQSALPYRFDLVPSNAMFAMANTLHEGAEKYGIDNWRGIPAEDHVNHVLAHLYAYLQGDTQDDHLAHALTRMAMAVEMDAVRSSRMQKEQDRMEERDALLADTKKWIY